MPFVPNGERLRALREQRGFTLEELASKSGVSDRQIRAIESASPPATIQLRTIRDLSGALKCEREEIATWISRPSSARANVNVNANADASDERQTRGARESEKHEQKLPPLSTLAKRAALERRLRIPARHLQVAGERVEVLGFDRLYEVDAAFGDWAAKRFGVEGVVTEHRPIPRYVEPVLRVKTGIGAQFLIVREVAREPLYVSIFTRTSAQTRKLIEAERAGAPIAAVARVVVTRPKGEWKGFFIFEKKPKPHPWALVIETLL
ncbi:MAG TPA: helix-turn-helix transcriptional regulator [Polyangia bacterium]|nr:helix-turn-helix transcriptional regulator [Polyangia bacterium]